VTWREDRSRKIQNKRQRDRENQEYWALRGRYRDRLWIPLARHAEKNGKTWAYFIGEE